MTKKSRKIRQMWVGMRDYVDLQIQNVKDAVKTANDAMDYRLAGMNEFRKTVSDQAMNYISKVEYDTWKGRVESSLEELKSGQLLLVSKAEYDALRDKLNDLVNSVNSSKDVLDTKASSRSQYTRDIITGITLAITIISFLIMIYKLSLVQ